MTDNYFILLGITFLLGVFLQNQLRIIAFKIGLIDKPSARKQHQNEVPLSGGIAIFLVFSFAVLLIDTSIHHLRVFFAGAMILVIIGILDDLHEIKATHRINIQILVAFIVFQFGDIALTDLGELLVQGKTLELRNYSLPMTILSMVGVINAFNMLDGIDGLAGSVAILLFLTLALLALDNGNIATFQILGLMVVSTFVFLLFNWRKNKNALVFMGDSGSLFIGYVFAYFLISLSQGQEAAFSPIVALWFFAYPVIDTVTMMFRRIIKGRSPFKADREHFHHLLLLAGFNAKRTTLIILVINMICIIIGLLIHYFKLVESHAFYAYLVLFVIYYIGVMRAWKLQRFFKITFVSK